MQTILISIHRKWNNLIFSEFEYERKTWEIRHRLPEPPFMAVVYEPKRNGGCGKVVGHWICDCKEKLLFPLAKNKGEIQTGSRLWRDEMLAYTANETKPTYAAHIVSPIRYSKPKELGEFRKPCISPMMPYCPACPVGREHISETEAEFYRVDGECSTEWQCLNFVRNAPQSYVRIETPNYAN